MRKFINAFTLRCGALAGLLYLALCLCAAAQQPAAQPYRISYELMMPQPATHLFEVRMRVEPQTPQPALEFQMPRWSPGRYAVFDFAKNVQGVRAGTACPPDTNCEQRALNVERVDTQTWRVALTEGLRAVEFDYKIFADDLSGTFSQLDERHANFNGGSIFMYVVGHKPDPVTLHITPPAGWRVTNGRMERAEQLIWQFDNYDIMIDTPTEIGPDWTLDEFKLEGRTYHVMLHAIGGDAGKRKQLVRDLEKIVRAETAMWGAPEFTDYTFLIHTGAIQHGDGMEHLTSTQIIQRRPMTEPGTYEGVLATAAHEFFHVWNVKRLRPVGLGPWDFTQPVVTHGLWIAEGFTNYYGHLMQRRAELWQDEQLYNALANEIGRIENAPGSRQMSAEESSLAAPFLDAACSVQQTNLEDTSVSYYDKGETIALVLDLLIRGRTEGRAALDDVMRRAYRTFYLESPNASYYLKGRGYTDEEFARVASEAAGFDLTDFFTRYTRGTEQLHYDEALAHVGLRLVRPPAAAPNHNNYHIEELPNATAQAKELRRAWLSAKRSEQSTGRWFALDVAH
jgi:predicted metalloprotease with PDZ domain